VLVKAEHRGSACGAVPSGPWKWRFGSFSAQRENAFPASVRIT